MGPDNTDSFKASIIEMRKLLKDYESGSISMSELRSRAQALRKSL